MIEALTAIGAAIVAAMQFYGQASAPPQKPPEPPAVEQSIENDGTWGVAIQPPRVIEPLEERK